MKFFGAWKAMAPCDVVLKGSEMDHTLRMMFNISAAIFTMLVAAPGPINAGPPFITDDPEPVEYRHAELYLASQFSYTGDGISGTGPLAEVNYGVIPDVQIHLIAPLAYAQR